MFKVAKPWDQVPRNFDGEPLVTEAKAIEEGAVHNVTPDTMQLLYDQGMLIKSWNSPSFATINEIVRESNFCYLRMDYIEGKTFRQLLDENGISKSLLLELLNVLAGLKQLPGYQYHGDIKPENIMVANDGKVTLLDPAYYGSLHCLEGLNYDCLVTTIAYYPILKPDDLFAVGISLGISFEIPSALCPHRTTYRNR